MINQSFPKRGEVYWVDLDPSVGVEAQKKRPCLILSNDKGNQVSHLVTVAPITSKVHNIYPFEVAVNVENTEAKVMVNQLRAIDKSRLGEKITSFDQTIMKTVDQSIKLVLSLS